MSPLPVHMGTRDDPKGPTGVDWWDLDYGRGSPFGM